MESNRATSRTALGGSGRTDRLMSCRKGCGCVLCEAERFFAEHLKKETSDGGGVEDRSSLQQPGMR